jgi:hypothetical protein
MTEPKTPVDPELAELFADDPDALAIVHAISATQRAPRHPHRIRVALLVAAAVVVGLIAFVGAVTQQSHAGVVTRALATFPTDATLHVVLRATRPAGTTIDVATGREQRPRHVIDEWFAPPSGAHRVVDELGGASIADVYVARGHGSSAAPSFTKGAAASFAATYQRALEANPDARVRAGNLGGARVYWITFSHSRQLSSVAVDRKTFVPLQAAFHHGATLETFEVVSIEALKRGTPVPKPRTRSLPATPSTGQANPLVVTILGRRVAHLPLAGTRPVRVGARLVGTEVLYGRPIGGRLPSSFVRVDESTDRVPQMGWTASIAALVRPGRIAIEQTGSFWNAYAAGHSRFFRLVTSEGRAVAIATARRLASP